MASNLNFIKWDFVILKEDWSRYRIDDGSIMKIRVAVIEIYRSIQTSIAIRVIQNYSIFLRTWYQRKIYPKS